LDHQQGISVSESNPTARASAEPDRLAVDRLVRLQALSAGLAHARSLEDIADVMIGQALPALQAKAALLAVLGEDGRCLRDIASSEAGADGDGAAREYSLQAQVPAAEAARTRRPVIVERCDDRRQHFPLYPARAGDSDNGADTNSQVGGAFAMFPLLSDGILLGALGFSFLRSRTFDAADIAFLQALADQCGPTMARVRLSQQVLHEVEERRRFEIKLRVLQDRLRLTLTSAKIVAWEHDLLTDHVVTAGAVEDMWGTEARSAADYYDAIAAEDRPAVKRAVASAIADGTPFACEFRVTGPDGKMRWLANRGEVERSPSGVALRLVGVTVDITESKRAQKLLEDEARSKDQFLAVLAHELRNPLAPIRNATQTLQRVMNENPRAAKMTEVIDRQSAHLVRIVDDLLDVSRVTQGRLVLQKEPLDLCDLVATTVADHRQTFESAGLTLELSLPSQPVCVLGDATRLAQALANLLHNSHKFTEPGGRVDVRVELDRTGTSASIHVVDTGMGMDSDMLARVFEPFAQADRTLHRIHGGLGLGAPLVKGLVELHGGSMNAYSAGPGHGSEFTITLPVQPQASTRAAPAGAVGVPSRRVLVIEDNFDAAEALSMFLEVIGHQVQVAHTGIEGIAAAERFHPDIVLSDIGLPGDMDGYDVARALRGQTGNHAYLVALSGYGQQQDKQRARAAGFDDHITKPVDTDVLERLLASANRG
jgi:signal transduction histidine kinase/CheY-like chemotaxis protein